MALCVGFSTVFAQKWKKMNDLAKVLTYNKEMKNMRSVGFAAALLLLVAGAYYAKMNSLGGGKSPQLSSQPQPAPDFSLKDGSGKTRSLSELKGNLVILHFWATWCPPCTEELPQWLAAAKKADGKPVKWLAISLDKTWDLAHKLLPDSKLSPNVISVLDAELKVPDLYGSYQFPESYLISPDGKILYKWIGPQAWDSAEFTKTLDELVSKFTTQKAATSAPQT
jgi:peroxiredoxin